MEATMSNVYGVWYRAGHDDELLGLFTTLDRARRARIRYLEEEEDPDNLYITRMALDQDCEFSFDIKGEVVDNVAKSAKVTA